MSSTTTGNKFGDFFSRNSKKILIGLITFVVISLIATGATWWSYQKETKDILAYVGTEKVTKEDFKKFSYAILRNGTPENPVYPNDDKIKESILEAAIEKILVHNKAAELGLTVSDNDALQSLKKKDGYYSESVVGASAILDYEKYLIEKESVSEKIGGKISGTVIIAREDIHYPESGVLTSELEEKIRSNAVYSKTFIDDIYAKLSSRSITAIEAVKLENEDKVIGKNANPLVQTIHSNTFSTDDYRNRVGLLTHDEILNEVNNLEAGKISSPSEIISSEKIVGDYANIAWFVVMLDETSNETGQNFNDWLFSEKNNVGITVIGNVNTRV